MRNHRITVDHWLLKCGPLDPNCPTPPKKPTFSPRGMQSKIVQNWNYSVYPFYFYDPTICPIYSTGHFQGHEVGGAPGWEKSDLGKILRTPVNMGRVKWQRGYSNVSLVYNPFTADCRELRKCIDFLSSWTPALRRTQGPTHRCQYKKIRVGTESNECLIMSSLQIQRWTAKEVADWLRGELTSWFYYQFLVLFSGVSDGKSSAGESVVLWLPSDVLISLSSEIKSDWASQN